MSREEMDALSDDQLVCLTVAAQILAMHAQTVRRLYHSGLLPGRQRARCATIRFRMGDLRDFVRGDR